MYIANDTWQDWPEDQASWKVHLKWQISKEEEFNAAAVMLHLIAIPGPRTQPLFKISASLSPW